MLPHSHILQLGSVRSHVGVILVLPDEGNNQVLPWMDPRSLQIGEPGDRRSGQTLLDEIH